MVLGWFFKVSVGQGFILYFFSPLWCGALLNTRLPFFATLITNSCYCETLLKDTSRQSPYAQLVTRSDVVTNQAYPSKSFYFILFFKKILGHCLNCSKVSAPCRQNHRALNTSMELHDSLWDEFIQVYSKNFQTFLRF